jgi:hypothetical protein
MGMAITYRELPHYKPSTEPNWAGKVLGRGSRTVQLMSDVWATGYFAVVWDEAAQATKQVSLGNDEFGTYATAEVDAPPEVVEQALAYHRALAVKNMKSDFQVSEARRQEAAMNDIRRGSYLKVVRGRKLKIGAEGWCFWIGENQWGTSVGIELADRSRGFTALKNVELVQPDFTPAPEPDAAEYDRRARAAVDAVGFATLYGLWERL